eukprot:1685144-Amphidinium_carterae.1
MLSAFNTQMRNGLSGQCACLDQSQNAHEERDQGELRTLAVDVYKEHASLGTTTRCAEMQNNLPDTMKRPEHSYNGLQPKGLPSKHIVTLKTLEVPSGVIRTNG